MGRDQTGRPDGVDWLDVEPYDGSSEPPPRRGRSMNWPLVVWVTAAAVVVDTVVLGVRAQWELFALGPDGIVRIQFALGRITARAFLS